MKISDLTLPEDRVNIRQRILQLKGHQFERWISDTEQFFQGSVDLESVFARLRHSSRHLRWAILAGYGAFAMFIVGTALALTGLTVGESVSRTDGYAVRGHAPWCALNETAKVMACRYYSEKHCTTSAALSGDVNFADSFCVPRPE